MGQASTGCREDCAALRRTPEVHELIQGEPRRGQRQVRAGRAGQEVLHPRPRPVAGDRRADADAEGQAQRRLRALRRTPSTQLYAK